ncbi:MAG: outer membrane beta-barrel protein [Chitinophagaceae bacterium]
MKKLLLTITLSIGFIFAFAQTEKGDWMVGGGLRLNTSDNSTEIALTPDAGIFIINNLAFGGNISFIYSKYGDAKVTSFGIGPFARYYFTNARVRPILHGNLNFLSQKTKIIGLPSSTNNVTSYFLGGGAAIFISDQVSIDGLMGYANSKVKNSSGNGGFALTVGFQIYLLSHQVDRLRSK